MSPIASGFWWLVSGFLLGWLAHALLSRRSRKDAPAAARRIEPDVAAESAVPASDDPAPRVASAPAARTIDVASARAAGFNLKHDDDLTIIEGIGPRIDELLHANGIGSFAQLAACSVPELLDILERGGPHFQFANPGSWAHQATLASENRWADLKRLQEELIAARPASA
jgi:predicted flap endonuclease-1-like 5' DNA nuclease